VGAVILQAHHAAVAEAVTIMKLHAQATLATRPAKQVHSLADLTAAWRERDSRVLGGDVSTLAGLRRYRCCCVLRICRARLLMRSA